MNPEVLAGTALALLLFFLLTFSLRRLKRHNEALRAAVSSCPECGGRTTVTPDPPNSRLVVRCEEADCAQTSWHPVRASALSVYGVVEFLVAILAGYLGLEGLEMLGGGFEGRILGALLGFVAGHALARLVVGMIVFSVLETQGSSMSPTRQEEIVAYLAPPPWRQSKAKDGVS